MFSKGFLPREIVEMDDDASEVVQLDVAARSICSHVTTDPANETSKFYIGTASNHQRNSIQIVEYDDYENVVTRDEIKPAFTATNQAAISKPIWQLAHLETILTTIQNSKLQLYNTDDKTLLAELDQVPAPLYCNISSSSTSDFTLNVLSADAISLVDVETLTTSQTIKLQSTEGNHILDPRLERGELRINPHEPSQIYQIGGKHLNLYDIRSSKLVQSCELKYRTRSFDVNPNRPDWVSVACDDRSISIFDMRQPQAPCLLDTGHTHWIWSLRYNPFHDRLMLSSGSDNRAILYHNFQTCSDNIKKTKWKLSACDSLDDSPRDHDSSYSDASESQDDYGLKVSKVSDGIVSSFDDFEDSVYGACWSHQDPWVWAAVSFDGKLVLSHVPKSVKYSILL